MRITAIGVLLAAALIFYPVVTEASTMRQTYPNPILYLNRGTGVITRSPITAQPAIGATLFGRVIVIDPGHGGSDCGAVGPDGVKEKDITLAISKELKILLEQDGTKVIMTRGADLDVCGPFSPATQELQARVDIANKANAYLFVSVHIDSFDSPEARGTTTYYFKKTEQDDQLARCVENGLKAQLHLQDRGDRSSALYVLENTNMPAVLTEVAYLSNPVEEQLCQANSFRKKAAMGIYLGIKNYFAGGMS